MKAVLCSVPTVGAEVLTSPGTETPRTMIAGVATYVIIELIEYFRRRRRRLRREKRENEHLAPDNL